MSLRVLGHAPLSSSRWRPARLRHVIPSRLWRGIAHVCGRVTSRGLRRSTRRASVSIGWARPRGGRSREPLTSTACIPTRQLRGIAHVCCGATSAGVTHVAPLTHTATRLSGKFSLRLSRQCRSPHPYGGFSPVRLQVTAPLAACPCASALCGDRRAPALCRAAGSASSLVLGRVKCIRTSPVAVTVCRELRVRLRQTRLPRLCVPAGVLRRTVDHPRALPSAAVVVSTASSVLRLRQTRAHGPTSRWRLYGPLRRSRTLPAGREPFPALRRAPCPRAAARTPAGSLGAFARLFPGDASLRRLVPGSAPCAVPDTHFCRGPITTRQHSLDARFVGVLTVHPRKTRFAVAGWTGGGGNFTRSDRPAWSRRTLTSLWQAGYGETCDGALWQP